MEKTGEKITVIALTAFYLLCSLRYFPGRPLETAAETAIHLLSIAPILVGALLVCHSLYAKITGEKLSWSRLARIYLTLGILFELILGLYSYLDANQAG